jgi:alpha-amylase
MRSICFYFQVHQPYRLRTYRFFDIGNNHHYYDEQQNRFIMRRVAEKCYLPMNQVLLDLINEYGSAFKVSFSISGTAIDQFEQYAPDVLDSFKALAATGHVEFIAETHAHALAALKSKEEFFEQVQMQKRKVEQHFGQTPTTFRNTELIYSDGIGEMVAEMGFNLMLTEGAKHVLGWKSPNYMYANAINPKLKLLLKNFRLSDDIAFRFSQQSWGEWPLTTEKFVGWLNEIDPKEEVVNLFMDYETFGEHQWPETGIFDFMRALPARVFSHSNFTFNTPAELGEKLQPVSTVHVPYPISWADEERDLTAWLGNELQDEAFDKLYSLKGKVDKCKDPDIIRDWRYLQTSDHFYYMCTKWFSDGDVHKYFNPYGTPYEAFINYMNVLSDFMIRVDHACPEAGFTEHIDQAFDKAAEIGKAVKDKTVEVGKTVKKKVKDSKVAELNLKDVADMSNAKIKELIRKVDTDELVAVVKDAGEDVRDRIIPNLGVRAKKKLDELEAGIRNVKKSDIKKYTTNVEKEIRKLFKK